MAGLSAIDLMSMSLGIEKQKLEATASNLANINRTFDSRLNAEGAKSVEIEAFPSIYDVIAGQGLNGIDSKIDSDASQVKKIMQFNGDQPTFRYQADVKIEEEMIKLNEATRAYEASIRLFNINKEMSGRIIRIGSKG